MAKERPILFSGHRVLEILAGMKTQTRSAIKPQPLTWDTVKQQPFERPDLIPGAWSPLGDHSEDRFCPYGRVGDRLWVREAWMHGGNAAPAYARRYRADDYTVPGLGDFDGEPWRPSIFLPRWASRITLEITEVRAQHVQSISEQDATAEGFESVPFVRWYEGMKPMLDGSLVRQQSRGIPPESWTEVRALKDVGGSDYDPLERSAKEGFCAVWDSINRKKFPWSSNPWVWAVSFQRIDA